MRLARVVGSIAAVVLLPVTAGPGAASTRGLSLAGVNVISATESAWVDVTLPRAATLDFPLLRKNRDLQVKARGRFAGIVLAKRPDFFAGPTLVGAVLRTCDDAGCEGRPTMLTNPLNMKVGGQIELPPGDYRLYVVADGAPVHVRLTLHGLDGSRRITPDAPADSSVGDLPTHVGGTPPAPFLVAGESFDLDRPALVMDGLWLGGNPSGLTDLGTCLYEGEPPAPPPVAYSAACYRLGADGYSSTTVTGSVGFAEMLLVFDSPLRAGRWSAGVHLGCTCYADTLASLRFVLQR